MHRIDLLTTTIAGCFVLATLGSSTVASAQAVSSFRDLRVSLKGGERLEITETSGVTTEGRFVSLSDQSLRVSAESARLIDSPEASVARIDLLKSRKKKGALVGFVGGFVGGLLAVALTPSKSDFGPSKESVILPLSAIFGGIGAAIGTGIGAAKPEHQRIFQAPPAGGGLTGAAPDGAPARRVLRARRWSLAVDIGRGASGPASDIEEAMRHAGLSDTSCACFGSSIAHPFSNTGFMSVGLPVLLEVEYRTREPWSLAATFSRTPVGFTSGYRDPSQFVDVEYGVYSAGLSINAAYRMVQAGIGPAVYIPVARQDSYPQRPWSHHTKVGFVAGGRTAVPAGARFFVEVRAEYRFVGRVDVGPYTAPRAITGAAATLPSTPVRYNHWFVGFGPGVRF